MGGAGAPHDPRGSGYSYDPPKVGPDDVLGSWDRSFLHGTNGPATDHAWTHVMPHDLRDGLCSDLTNVGDPRGGHWSPDDDRHHGMGTPHRWAWPRLRRRSGRGRQAPPPRPLEAGSSLSAARWLTLEKIRTSPRNKTFKGKPLQGRQMPSCFRK